MQRILFSLIFLALLLTACQAQAPAQPADGKLHVLTTTGFLADFVQQVAGDRAVVDSLIPAGVDPHAFEPAPQDVTRIAASSVLVINGAGFEEWLKKTLENAGGSREIIDASQGLTPRPAGDVAEHPDGDPHFWLDPVLAKTYVTNIRDGLIKADPSGAETYTANAAAALQKLDELDAWIRARVATIPAQRRLLVTNHESFGYFADRYGFTLVGAVIPSVSSSASPTAQDLARLIDQIRQTGAPAIFLESGSNPQLADQVARETGVKVVTGLLTHSFGPEAQDYIAMLKWDVGLIVEALK
ncbi:ABC-type metal ion transport system, periplasmic component/surface adhesin [Longilinea arvoryzae]|uniref:ABC-type metal ion transport system, periplasmic component/surface adhesin n=1 Tax=Longilinea arvoryzae TaxID=360412 RepID=A0A0K8MXS9_9CHLR|nr:metal ABC transporter substrate-binding protein [Longilinea arvoryzae]GAP16010.1 ABC-type metal ion transport system, periplasmic component/surface adhesin [Longilinea arvoryzae]